MTLWLKILGGVLVLAVITWALLELRADGARSVTNEIKRQNNVAAHSAGEVRSEYDTCPDGLWDFGAGKCRGPAPGRRH